MFVSVGDYAVHLGLTDSVAGKENMGEQNIGEGIVSVEVIGKMEAVGNQAPREDGGRGEQEHSMGTSASAVAGLSAAL